MTRVRMSGVKEGTRIRLTHLANDYDGPLVKVGDTGEVAFVDDTGTVHVNWDHGAALGLIPGRDRWEELPPAGGEGDG